METYGGEEANGINANDRVKSRAPGSKGWEGKVLHINGDNVRVKFDDHFAAQSVPANYLTVI